MGLSSFTRASAYDLAYARKHEKKIKVKRYAGV